VPLPAFYAENKAAKAAKAAAAAIADVEK